jgi:hypothetical protein
MARRRALEVVLAPPIDRGRRPLQRACWKCQTPFPGLSTQTICELCKATKVVR